MYNNIIIMDSTETKYNFYKRAFKGGAQTTQQSQSETVSTSQQELPQQELPQQELPQQESPQQESPQQANEGQAQPMPTDGENLQQINQEVPRNKINFKVTSIVGNLDQTLGPKQKINFDKLIMKQLFGSN
jgi:hypothetical protein